MANRNTPFGMPNGTVRAILTILLVIAVVVIGIVEIKTVLFLTMNNKFDKDAIAQIHIIFTSIYSLATFMLGYYISKVNGNSSKEISNRTEEQ